MDKYPGILKQYDQGLSVEEIAALHGISRQSMWKNLRRRGCKFRPHIRRGKESHFYRSESECDEEAFQTVRRALERGELVRRPCQVCGENQVASDGRSLIHAHHCDYNRPLDVMWLCQKHHHEWHAKNTAIPRIGGGWKPRWKCNRISAVSDAR